jgi:hypothetical protein
VKLLILAITGAVYGLITGYIFQRLTNRTAFRISVNRIIAHLLELILFIDEPRTILRAQINLFRANVRLLKQVLVPLATSALLFGAIYAPLDPYLGHGPLVPQEPAVVTVATLATPLRLIAPREVTIETPPVQSVHSHETSWRIRPLTFSSGPFHVVRDGRKIPQALEIPWPPVHLFHLHWLVWFLLISGIAAIARLAQPI